MSRSELAGRLHTLLTGGATPGVAVIADALGPDTATLVPSGMRTERATDSGYLDLAAAALATGPDIVYLAPPFDALRRPSDLLEPLLMATSEVPRTVMTVPVATTRRAGVFSQLSTEILDERRLCAAVWYTPQAGVLPELHDLVGIVTLVLERGGGEPAVCRFFQVPPPHLDVSDDEIEADLARLLRQGGGATAYGFVLREAVDLRDGVSFGRLHPDRVARQESLRTLGDVRPFAELGNFVPTLHLTQHRNRLQPRPSAGARRVFEPKSITRSGWLDHEAVSHWVTGTEAVGLESGDLVLSSMPPRGGHGLLVAEVTPADLPAVAAHTTIVFRPDVDATTRQMLAAFLRSPAAVDALVATEGEHVLLTKPMLGGLSVPVPDDALLRSLDVLEDAVQQLRSWANEAEKLLDSGVDFDDPATSRRVLLDQSRQVRERVTAAQQLDNLSHRVRTRYPYPVAARWREATAASGGETLRALLACAEVLTSVLSLVGLAICRTRHVDVGVLAAVRAGDGSMNFGTWRATLNELAVGKAFRKLADDDPLSYFVGFLHADEAKEALSQLYQLRNDEYHLRSAGRHELDRAVERARTNLLCLLAHAEFLADLDLRYIERLHHDTIAGITRADYRSLMGDHAIVPIAEADAVPHDLEQGSLYVVDTDGAHVLLRPFLVLGDCRECGLRSVWHLDGTPEGEVRVKALDHGHTMPLPNERNAFEAVGLIESSGNAKLS